MRIRWKLAALAFVAIAVCFLLIVALTTMEIEIYLPSIAVVTSEDIVDRTDRWIGKAIMSIFALIGLGVLAWVARHILRRPREPNA